MSLKFLIDEDIFALADALREFSRVASVEIDVVAVGDEDGPPRGIPSDCSRRPPFASCPLCRRGLSCLWADVKEPQRHDGHCGIEFSLAHSTTSSCGSLRILSSSLSRRRYLRELPVSGAFFCRRHCRMNSHPSLRSGMTRFETSRRPKCCCSTPTIWPAILSTLFLSLSDSFEPLPGEIEKSPTKTSSAYFYFSPVFALFLRLTMYASGKKKSFRLRAIINPDMAATDQCGDQLRCARRINIDWAATMQSYVTRR